MHRPRLRPLATALAVALLAGACASAGGTPAADDTAGPRVLTALTAGDPLPEVSLARLGGDEQVATSSWRGTPTVINFWATWCAFCVEEMPDLQAAKEALDGRVHFVGVDREDRLADALAFLDEVGVDYEQVSDPDGSFFRAVQARGMPTTVFVDAGGVIRYRHAGPLTRDRLLELVDEHLGVRA